jgi:hypothetical protein
VKERCDDRVLGALEWRDAVTEGPIRSWLEVTSPRARFTRNLSGRVIIAHVEGFESYERVLDLGELAPGDVIAPASVAMVGQVWDPTGAYLPRQFTVLLPLNPSPEVDADGVRPAGSLFTPVTVRLLPGAAARVEAGAAQIRVSAARADGRPLGNVLIRALATSNGGRVLGRGMTDARGEGLVIVPGLKLFAPGEGADEVTTSETEVRLQTVLPPPGEAVVDWDRMEASAGAAGVNDTQTLKLKAGGVFRRPLTLAT